jgi:peptidylprolyl isomerase
MDFFPDTTALVWQTGPEGLRYAVVREGVGEGARAGENVSVHYTGWLTSGQKFDSSRDRGEPFGFTLGAGQVVRGWDLGVEGMKQGEKRILSLVPGLGYGSRGAGIIPPNAQLIFAVEKL